jgi:hypothetical protein
LKVTVSIEVPSAGSDNVPYTFTTKIMNAETDATPSSGDAATKFAALQTAVSNAATANVAKYYKDGVTYYNARIKHFGEDETPWSATKPWLVIEPGTTVQQIYGFGNSEATIEGGVDNSAKRFLGRYGVVRDNWYDLVIDAVNELGSAEPIDVSANGTPDDEVKNYMSVHVHIIPWVLRTQHISF